MKQIDALVDGRRDRETEGENVTGNLRRYIIP